jgi:hypothetical protein
MGLMTCGSELSVSFIYLRSSLSWWGTHADQMFGQQQERAGGSTELEFLT